MRRKISVPINFFMQTPFKVFLANWTMMNCYLVIVGGDEEFEKYWIFNLKTESLKRYGKVNAKKVHHGMAATRKSAYAIFGQTSPEIIEEYCREKECWTQYTINLESEMGWCSGAVYHKSNLYVKGYYSTQLCIVTTTSWDASFVNIDSFNLYTTLLCIREGNLLFVQNSGWGEINLEGQIGMAGLYKFDKAFPFNSVKDKAIAVNNQTYLFHPMGNVLEIDMRASNSGIDNFRLINLDQICRLDFAY